MRRAREAGGFALLEVLIGSAITLVLIAVTCQLAADAHASWRSASARVDLQQRARVIVDLLSRTLREGGVPPLSGPARTTLVRGIPAILPRRVGTRGPHPPDEFRNDAFTVLRALADTEGAVLATPAAAGTTVLELAGSSTCVLAACGFDEGASLLLLDATGQYDIFTVVSVAGMVIEVRHHGPSPSAAYPAGTAAIAVESASFAVDAPSRSLRRYDGDLTDLPVVDDVVEMGVAYFGESLPPVWPKPPAGAANCLYDADGSYQAALLPALGSPGRLVELTEATLTDGPWCGTGDTRFDADLLRVRRVRVSLRLQAGDASVRGTDRARFSTAGFARDAAVVVPDITVAFDLTLRNLRLE